MAATPLAGCGHGDDSAGNADSVEFAVWVSQFDDICTSIGAELERGDALTPDEIATFNAGAFTVVTALAPPDEKTNEAAELIDTLIASQQPGLDDTEIAALDEQLRLAMDALGISEACTGPPAEG